MVSAYRNGMSAGVGGGNPNPKKRGEIQGWSAGAVRRHTKWLYTVDAPKLTGVGYAFTLTVRDIPESHDEFVRMRDAWLQGLRDRGAIRFHWVVEWTARKRPHIHAAVYFPEKPETGSLLTNNDGDALFTVARWVSIAGDYGAGFPGQHYAVIDGPLGWLQYLSKHAARGVRHYQRSGKPAGWEKTGRLWGHGGDWPAEPPMRFDMEAAAYHRYRRLVRAWRVANARADTGNPRRSSRIGYARRMLACSDRRLSAVRGVSDWVPESVSLAFVALLASEGYRVDQVE